ncbi:MAG TPA: hydroxymethylbilane synthase [Micromonosporaceae bacterium]|nr:hydroxymethylbilane synthase [Micromonosporaceae bacterium]
MSLPPLRLGTRSSRLARAQSQHVADALKAATGREVELVNIITPGDQSTEPVHRLGVGVFVSALRDALIAGEIDFAVHSYKDLPTAGPEELYIAAVPPREDPRDALVSRGGRTLAELPPGSTVGTGALRRIAQLHALGLQLTVVPIRGNIDKRLARVFGPEADLDAVVLARAGLSRVGQTDDITETIDPMMLLPAPAQGALAVECRTDDRDMRQLLAVLDDRPSRLAVTAERAFLATLEAGCSAPVAAFAVLAEGDDGEEIYLRGAVISPDGYREHRLSSSGPVAPEGRTDAATALTVAEEIGRSLATELLDAGADKILDAPVSFGAQAQEGAPLSSGAQTQDMGAQNDPHP